MNRMKERYQKDIVPVMMKEFSLGNIMQVPRVTKVIVNIGMGEARENPKALDAAVSDITQITGQKTDRHQGQESHRQFQVARGNAEWHQGDIAWREDVVIS